MTNEQINIAIAEACGYSDVRIEWWEWVDVESRSIAHGEALQGTINGRRVCVPDYLNDLNAMHEAEETLMPCHQDAFAYHLIEDKHALIRGCVYESSVFKCAHASPRERAVAFLKTIGKWEEAAK